MGAMPFKAPCVDQDTRDLILGNRKASAGGDLQYAGMLAQRRMKSSVLVYVLTNVANWVGYLCRPIQCTIIMFFVIGGRVWGIGRDAAFRPKGHGFASRSSRHVGTLGKFLTHSCLWLFGVQLRHSIRHNPCCVGSAPE